MKRESNLWIYVLGAIALLYFFSNSSAATDPNQTTLQPPGGINPVLAVLGPQYLPQCPGGEQLGWNSAGVPSCVAVTIPPTGGIS